MKIEDLYLKAKRFDESDVYQSPEYDQIALRQIELYTRMHTLFGPSIIPLLEEYTAQIGEECELECRHFFRQGFLMGQEAGCGE